MIRRRIRAAWVLGLLGVLAGASLRAETLGRVGLVFEETAPFLVELERELQFLSFDVVRVESSGNEAEWVARLAKFDADRGIRIAERGAQAVLFHVEKGRVREDGRYPINQQDRLARRRLWIWLGEHLRAIAEVSGEAPPVVTAPPKALVHRPPPVTGSPPESPASLRPFSLGAASMLGYGSGTAFLGSHILVTGSAAVHERFAVFANLLWPLLAVAEDSRGVTRSWTFQLQGGLWAYPAPLHWRARPYVGAGTGIQFMMIEAAQAAGGITSSRGSLITSGQGGLRFYLSDRVALFLHLEAGYSLPMGGSTVGESSDPARGIFRRLGLGLLFDG